MLTEAAEAAPAVFNVHVKQFIDAVWFPLRDPKQHIREAAVRALKVGRGGGVQGAGARMRRAGARLGRAGPAIVWR